MAPGFNRTEAEARDYYIKKQARKEFPMMKADGDRYDTQMIGENAGLVLCECHVYVPQEYKLVISEVQRVTMLMRRDGSIFSSRIFMRPIPGLLSAKMKNLPLLPAGPITNMPGRFLRWKDSRQMSI